MSRRLAHATHRRRCDVGGGGGVDCSNYAHDNDDDNNDDGENEDQDDEFNEDDHRPARAIAKTVFDDVIPAPRRPGHHIVVSSSTIRSWCYDFGFASVASGLLTIDWSREAGGTAARGTVTLSLLL
ncbi:hypothetical protein QTP88_008039 [Uroleucon formosanum]